MPGPAGSCCSHKAYTSFHSSDVENQKMFYQWQLEGTARYASQLLAPAEGLILDECLNSQLHNFHFYIQDYTVVVNYLLDYLRRLPVTI